MSPRCSLTELRKLNRELGIPAKLSDVGVTEDKIPEMVADTMKSGNVLVNPRQTTPKDVEALYRSFCKTAEPHIAVSQREAAILRAKGLTTRHHIA